VARDGALRSFGSARFGKKTKARERWRALRHGFSRVGERLICGLDLMDTIPIVDFFAGPGGLGEGFSTFRTRDGQAPYRIGMSIEKDPIARTTLRLRSFFRQFETVANVPRSYYEYVSGRTSLPFDLASKSEWEQANSEAMCATLGVAGDDERIEAALRKLRLDRQKWVLIGGPPCQAYSVVGRSRNAGIKGYRPEKDDRHFLYQHYLRVLHKLRPAAFVFENVKGILSSKVADKAVFTTILRDLSEPSRALRISGAKAVRYRILAVASGAVLEPGADLDELDVRRFVVRGEEHGLGQARHRVILIGIRDDIPRGECDPIPFSSAANAGDLLSDLPMLRSGLSEGSDDFRTWVGVVRGHATKLATRCMQMGLVTMAEQLHGISEARDNAFPQSRFGGTREQGRGRPPAVRGSLLDRRLSLALNHQTRSHMEKDLARYLFCATFGAQYRESPKAAIFPKFLAPEHSSWEKGDFVDRFRVQLRDRPSTTITSHISKDGHYFIHPDPFQCRSLTVREAARLQGFPDNYFFEGNRTQQYVQVGNAVPPPLARLIAGMVYRAIGG